MARAPPPANAALGASLGGLGDKARVCAWQRPVLDRLGQWHAGSGDPAIPRSPNAIAAGIPLLTAVPEPQTLVLLLLLLLLLLAGLAVVAVVAGGLQSNTRRPARRVGQA